MMAQSTALSLGGLLGKYTPKTHTVHIATTPFKHGLQTGEYSEKLATDMVRLVVAHELAHALQQEATDLLTGLKLPGLRRCQGQSCHDRRPRHLARISGCRSPRLA